MYLRTRCTMLILVGVTFEACNNIDGNAVRPGTWSVVSVPTTQGLRIVRGSSQTDVWMVGDTILRWDGQSLHSGSDSVVKGGVALWVNAPNDAWVGVGQKVAYRWSGAPPWTAVSLNDNRAARTLWGSGPSDVWTSDCLGGYFGHYDGTSWNHINSVDQGVAIWGLGTSDVWMIERGVVSSFSCDSGSSLVAHWNGITGLGGKQTQLTSPQNLRAIWGSSVSDIWAVGEAGAIVHYDGIAWSQLHNSPTAVGLHGVWGTAASDVWAVGDSGVILHFDGSSWAKAVSPTKRTLRAVWGDVSGGAWAVGDAGTVLQLTR